MAGPNGSVKSTVLKAIRNQFYCGPYINADEIEKSLKQNGFVNTIAEFNLKIEDGNFESFLSTTGKSWLQKATDERVQIRVNCKEGILVVDGETSSYDAAIAADFIRHQLLLSRHTFTFETVLSHPSKLEFLKTIIEKGFLNYLYFICTVDPAINISRVNQRTALGGHHVPADRIESRYKKSRKYSLP